MALIGGLVTSDSSSPEARARGLADSLQTIQADMAIRDDNICDHRYEERDGGYVLRTWRGAKLSSRAKDVASRPEWLTIIINVAIVGGHVRKVPKPPPDLIVWFRTDKENNLTEFIDFNPHPSKSRK